MSRKAPTVPPAGRTTVGWRFVRQRWHYFAGVGSPSRCGALTFSVIGGGPPSRPAKPTLTAQDREGRAVCEGCDVPGAEARQRQLRTRIRDAKFVSEYLKTGNATEAYQRARGYKGSRQAARQKGMQRLRKPSVKRALGRALLKVQLSDEQFLAQIENQCQATLRDYYDEDGNVVPPQLWTVEAFANVQRTETIIKNAEAGDGVTDTVLKLAIVDKHKSQELLAKLRGKLKDTSTLVVDEKLLALLDEGRRRNAEGDHAERIRRAESESARIKGKD